MAEPSISLGPFDLLSVAGRGATGEVWRAVHRAQGLPAAVKIITAPHGGATEVRRHLAREVRAVARLDHPGIVRLFDQGELPASVAEKTGRFAADTPYLVMAWVEGGTLGEQVGRLAWPTMRATLLALLDALGHAHARGVVHRDLKVANVLLGPGGPVLTDFGVAVALDTDRSGERKTAGTPNYMAPEQIRGDWRAVGPWTDLYALGCLAYALASGRTPFAGRGARGVMAAHLTVPVPRLMTLVALPLGFEDWLLRLLAKSPAERFRFAADAAVALRALNDDMGDISASIEGVDSTSIDEDATVFEPPAFVPVSETAWDAGPTADGRPPPPADWRRPDPPLPAAPLRGTGRALFALREPLLIGREAERDHLWAALRAVAAGEGAGLVLIEGASGTGKSHLATWLARRAHELAVAEPLRVTHDHPNGPSCGLGPMLARHLRTQRLEGEALITRVQAGLAPVMPVEAELFPALAAATRPDHRVDGPTPVALGSPRERYETICRGLGVLADRRPLLMVVDDAQWGEDALRF
ncbi:MAG: serine/threonine-protein kinase PknK, partial [Myxococcales bacterium]|nr:serine/threonine-protein kinase PknK [Myxococcales bacterium]